MITRTLSVLLFPVLLCVGVMLFASTAMAQRDHLTPQEVDLVKEAQMLDKRIDVFIKAADRRVFVLKGGTAAIISGSRLRTLRSSLRASPSSELRTVRLRKHGTSLTSCK